LQPSVAAGGPRVRCRLRAGGAGRAVLPHEHPLRLGQGDPVVLYGTHTDGCSGGRADNNADAQARGCQRCCKDALPVAAAGGGADASADTRVLKSSETSVRARVLHHGVLLVGNLVRVKPTWLAEKACIRSQCVGFRSLTLQTMPEHVGTFTLYQYVVVQHIATLSQGASARLEENLQNK